MTPSEAASRLWDVAVLCGRLEALGHLGKLGDAALTKARQDAVQAGCSHAHVDHATLRGLEWGASDVTSSQENEASPSKTRSY